MAAPRVTEKRAEDLDVLLPLRIDPAECASEAVGREIRATAEAITHVENARTVRFLRFLAIGILFGAG